VGNTTAVFDEMPGIPLDLMRDYDLAALGYEEAEYLVTGTASSYELKGERGEDGRWDVVPAAEAPFRTRIVVRRPSDPSRFSGVVIVEWHNVSAGLDAAPDWGFFHRAASAAGHVFVGVSAQKAGIDGGGIAEGIHLKLLDPGRYAQLDHPGDAWSFDIFTQVGRLLRLPADENPLRGLTAQRLIAAGESQSAACLVTYVNAIDPHTEVFDGYFVHGRPAAGLTIDGVFVRSARPGAGLPRARKCSCPRANGSVKTPECLCSCCRARPTSSCSAARRRGSPTAIGSVSGRWRGRPTPTPTR